MRHLVGQILALAQPPYSAPLLRSLLALFTLPRTLEAHRGEEQRRSLLGFARHAAGVAKQMPELAEEAEEAVAALQRPS